MSPVRAPRAAARLLVPALAAALLAPSAAGAPAAAAAAAVPAAAPTRTAFSFVVSPLSEAQKATMRGVTWRPGCPVPLEALVSIRLTHRGFDGKTHRGTLVVHRDAAPAMRTAFASLYAAGFPIRRIVPIEAYGGDDDRSMRADNTSGFNCRKSTGSATTWSRHASGRAVDVNPLENPYVVRGRTKITASAPFVDRSRTRPGMIQPGSAAERAFTRAGWFWGGRWRSVKDYQHFSSDNR